MDLSRGRASSFPLFTETALLYLPLVYGSFRLGALFPETWVGVMVALFAVVTFAFVTEGRNLGHSNGIFRLNARPGLAVGAGLVPLALIGAIVARGAATGRDATLDLLSYYLLLAIAMSAVGVTRHVRVIQLAIAFLLVPSVASAPQSLDYVAVAASIALFLALNESIARSSGASFTAGEALLVSTMLSLLFTDAAFVTVQRFSSSSRGHYAAVERGPVYYCFLGLCLGIVVCGVLLAPVMVAIATRSLPRKGPRRVPSAPPTRRDAKSVRDLSTAVFLFYFGFVAIVLVPLRWWLGAFLKSDPFVWVFDYVVLHPTRLALAAYWALSIAACVGTLIVPSVATRVSRTRKTVVRKYFHALAVAMFVPGYVLDAQFTRLAMAVAVAAFVFVEFVRAARVPPLGNILHDFLSQYVDARDAGPFILTHTYLLLGCAIPMWLEGVVGDPNALLPSVGLSGVLALGIGDALASIVGSAIGRTKWPGTPKSVEGTLASLVGQLAGAFAICAVHPECGLGERTRGSSRTAMEALVLLCGCLLEAVTDQIDNIVLPVYVFSLLCFV